MVVVAMGVGRRRQRRWMAVGMMEVVMEVAVTVEVVTGVVTGVAVRRW